MKGASRPIRHARCSARRSAVSLVLVAVVLTGCGTTRMSDSKRTATEQLLVSEAIERAVMRIDVRPLAGQRVFLDTAFLDDVADGKYLTSALRHQLLAAGCMLAPDRDSAMVVVEARAGTIGTDRSSVILGLPATSMTLNGHDTSTPELALAKRSEQRGVAKLNVYAYERETGRPVWQSGMEHVASHSRNRWYFGAGPFQDGEIHDQPAFAGRSLRKEGRGTEDAAEASVAGGVDLTKPRVLAALPPGGGEPARTVTADQRPVDLSRVR